MMGIFRGKSFILVATLVVAVMSTALLHAAMPKLKRVTVKGELLDMACYSTMNMTGRAHGTTCGRKCLASGLPAGVLVHGQAWTLLTSPVPLAKYVGKEIKVQGKVDAKDKAIYPIKMWWRMGAMWMKVSLSDNLHK